MVNESLRDIIDVEWHRTEFANEFFKSLLHRGQRRQFGLLERPSLPPSKETTIVEYKIFLCGRSGVGKTATVAKLAGNKIPNVFSETAGIETTSIYWPVRVKATNKVVFFRLNIWDVGDNAIRKFEHILPACQSNADCYIYTFSFTDRSSFEDIPQLISRMMGDDNNLEGRKPAQIIMGTRADQYIHSDISEMELRDLAQAWRIPLLRTKNTYLNKPATEQIYDIAPILDVICGMLWQRDNSQLR
uniref:ciliogenesis and planar polarity effector 2-like n=1 Tax=Styela clava TaxID=7725 RepID=UPI001939E0C2|nr:ciliogenesis and planar polarity effector 2-like [Styela clava]